MLNTMQTIVYVRVSTDRQAEQGVSLEAQEAKESSHGYGAGN
jgi:DNA invertase Pin-like site-specific DNA recombinase